MHTLDIEVRSDGAAYWVAVDDQDVEIAYGKGHVEVADGDHVLAWWLVGSPGQTIEVSVSESGAAIRPIVDGQPVESVTGEIPERKRTAGGVALLDL